jgi:hypothetical protein
MPKNVPESSPILLGVHSAKNAIPAKAENIHPINAPKYGLPPNIAQNCQPTTTKKPATQTVKQT